MRVEEHLASLVNTTVYYDPLVGNVGDDLILAGIQEQMKRFDLSLTGNPRDAGHLLIKGGGAFFPAYQSIMNHIRHLLSNFPETPVTILPTSYGLREPFSSFCDHRKGRVTIFAREKKSLELLKAGLPAEGNVEVFPDHDSAFHLADSRWLKNLKRRRTGRHLLIVERIDQESLTGESASNRGNSADSRRTARSGSFARLNSFLPDKLRLYLKRQLMLPKLEKQNISRPFTRNAIEFLYRQHPDTRELPVRAFDISQRTFVDLDEFASLIASSAVVLTTRLHVGILAAMLDIPVYLVEGVYHKISGIYEMSMKQMPHVKVLRMTASNDFVIADSDDPG